MASNPSIGVSLESVSPDLRAVIQLAQTSIALRELGPEHAVAVVPEGFQLLNASQYLPPPPWVRQRVTLGTPDSFIQYVQQYRTDQSAVFFDQATATFSAVFDYHGAALPGRCAHVATYKCPPSREWLAWTGMHDRLVAQEDFARFIENNLPDVMQPAPADMMQLALTLQVKKAVQFESGVRLRDGGQSLRFEETVRGTTSAGDIVIPDTFLISIPVFVGGVAHSLAARLNYRIRDAKLQMGFELVRHQQARDLAVDQVGKLLATQLPEVRMYAGTWA